MMGATSSVFVGRQVELELVSSALEESRASRPQIVSIEGEPGIGKSAFLHRVLPKEEDIVLLEASGDESEVALDYGILSQLASNAALVGSTLNERIDDPASASAFSVGAELLDLLGTLQEKAAVVVVAVDDAHLMDPPSASALLFALRRLRADRVLVLLASRSEEIDRLGPSWMRLLGDDERAHRVRLSGLSARDVSLLASSLGFDALTLAAGERLREHTGGHPLYIKSLLSELPPDALAFDGPLPAPHSYAATVISRLTSVAPDAQDLVAAAAVAGNRCPLALAGSLAGVGDPLTAVEDAINAELLALVPARFPEEVTFPHPLVRAAVYDDLSPSVRRRLHMACAELTSGSASLPHRVAASAGSDDALAAELSASADEQEARGNLTAAAEHLLSASRIAANREAREAALLRAVEHLVHAGEFPRAAGHLDAVFSCADGPRRSYVLAILTASLGQVAEGQAALRELAEHPDFASGDPDLAGSVFASLAVLSAVRGDGEEAVNSARRAGQAQHLSPTAKVIAAEGLAWGLSLVGHGREAIAVLDGVSPGRMRPQPFEAELLTARGNFKSWWGDLPGAVEDLSAVIRWSREGASLRSLPNAFGALAEAEYRVGRWDDALTHAEVAVSLGEDTDRVWDLPFVHAVASYLHADRGNRQFAIAHADAARRAAEVTPAPVGRYYACVAAGHLAWVQEDWTAVVETLAPLHTPPRPILMTGLERVPWLLEAEAMIRSGRLDDGERTLRSLRDAADESGQDVTGVDLWRLFGVLEHARGRLEQARAAFAEGEAAAEAADSPFAQGMLELARGHFLHKTGSRRAAIAALRLARGAFERLGARPFLERCDAELAACGVRPPRDGADDDYGLTAREQVVARLVASGKSNREVAAELYLSSKAIEYHLANIFTKVGITSRHQLASRIAP